MSKTLVAQTESQHPSSTGHYFGFEVFKDDGVYTAVIHTRTYDGIKVDSHWACPEQTLEATDYDGAVAEARAMTVAYVNSVLSVTV